MTYKIVPLELTPMELEGLSEKLIASHYEEILLRRRGPPA